MVQAGSVINPNINLANKTPLRSFGALHRDFWLLVLKNPLVFMVFPTLIFLPTDIVIAFATQDMEAMQALRLSTRIQQVSSLVFGTFAAAMMIWTLKEMVKGERPSFAASLRGGKHYWGAISITAFQVGWRVGLATLLLIVPGVVLAVRYCFALPVTVFEDIHGKPALTRSKELGAGFQWPLFLSFFFSVFIYLPVVFALLFLFGHLADQAGFGVWAEVVSTIPINLAFAFMTIGTAFLYLESKTPELLQAMIHRAGGSASHVVVASPRAYDASGSSFTGVVPPVLALLSWGGAGFFLVSYFGLGIFLIMAGNFYAERGDLDKSRYYFQRAVELEPENPDYHFTLGSQYLHADKDNDKAIASFEKVIALDPKHGEAHLALSTAYYFKGDFEIAKKHLAIAETLPIESADLLNTLKEDELMQP